MAPFGKPRRSPPASGRGWRGKLDPDGPAPRRHGCRLRSPRTPTRRHRARIRFSPVILAIDQGTSGTTCIVFDEHGGVRGRAYSEFEQHFPRPGWVEHEAGEIWDVTRRVAREAIAQAGARELRGI